MAALKSTWWRVRHLLGDRVSSAAALVLFSTMAALTEAGILTITAQVATSLVNGASRVHISAGPVNIHTTIATLLLIAMELALVRFALQIPLAYFPAAIAGDVQAGLRRQVFAAFTAASWDLQSQDREGHLQDLMTTQVTYASVGAMAATTLVTSFFTLSILVVSAFALNVAAALTVLVAAIGMFLVLRPLTSAGSRAARALSAAQMQYAGAVNEANAMAEETHVFGAASAQNDRVNAFIDTSRKLYVRTNLVQRAAPGIYQSMIFIVLVLGLIVLNGVHPANLSSLGAVVLLLVRAGTYGQVVQTTYQQIRQCLPFIERLQEATDRYLASAPVSGDLPIEPVRTLTFDRVSYAYHQDRPVLSQVTFEVNGGETIGVVGPSGAGKSTLVQLLLGLRAPDSGEYLINGVPAMAYAREDWSRRVVYVPQQPRLVYASVAENVRFFRPIADDAVERACRQARIHDEIMSWPQGYDTIVGPRAEAVSGGQQQRICLARALAVEPDVLVLDEPTSALDPRSEALIQESLTALKDSLTLFVIAHRMSTLTICDRVMVILDGRLNAFDTVEVLQNSNQYYRHASAFSLSTRNTA